MTGRPGGATPAVDVVIVNWNTGDCLRACVESLARSHSVASTPLSAR